MSETIKKLLTDNGVIQKGHFLLTSGLHSGLYFEKFMILENPRISALLCSKIAMFFSTYTIDKVIGPTIGGAIIAYEVARQLGTYVGIAEKESNEKRIVKRGSSIEKGERILVVDDVLTTGGSIKATIDAVLQLEGKVTGISVLIDRSENPLDFTYPFFAVYKTSVENYTPENCPLCKKGIPLIRKGGSGKIL